MTYTPGPADYLREEYDRRVKRKSRAALIGNACRTSTADLEGPGPARYWNGVKDIESGHRSPPKHSISR